MSLKQITKAYFTFSRRELNGIIVLLSILTVVITFNRILPIIIKPPDPTILFKNEIALFIKEQKHIKDSIAKADSSRRSDYYKKPTSRRHVVTPSPAFAKASADTVRIELNSADTSDLILIRGIGPVFATRILKYRKILGGFYCKEQLLEVYGIDSVKYIQIEKQITVDTSRINKININTASFKEILKHPYLDYEDVKRIFTIRNRKKELSEKNIENLQFHNNLILKYLTF